MFQITKFKKTILFSAMLAALLSLSGCSDDELEIEQSVKQSFNRVSSFPVYLNSDINNETVAEIVVAANNGNALIYTDGALGKLGFVDITDIHAPLAAGTVDVGGEPTSVAVIGNFALAAVNTSLDYVNVSGELKVIDINTKAVLESIALHGQPDAIAVSPDGQYAVIVIENERDEDLGEGVPPQMPAGLLKIIKLDGEPGNWTISDVSLSGLADLFGNDPEPEYVDINEHNIALVTLQENNHIVLVNLVDASIRADFSAGSVDLHAVDASKDGLISLTENLTSVLREPDGVTWLADGRFATANEGDLSGGSRGFTLFNADGSVDYESAESIEHLVVKHGHFADKRAGKKGNEPENVEHGRYGETDYLFVGSERSSVVLVYKVAAGEAPEFWQLLPSAVKPEGLLAIPQRNLFVAAGEKDDRGDKIRSALTLYQLQQAKPDYPTIVSNNNTSQLPIPWGALSGLAIDPLDDQVVYTVSDSFYKSSRVFVMDISDKPAQITRAIVLQDSQGVLSAIAPELVNGDADATVNLDPEGITVAANGGFWIASEGKGTIGDLAKPFAFENMLLRISSTGAIEQVVTLPTVVADRQRRFGFEGVSSVMNGDAEMLYVVFQRSWAGDAENHVRIGQYNTQTAAWTFFYYELDAVESANGGWVGLSEISSLGNDEFMVIERDNQSGTDAKIKRLYKFSISGLTPLADDGSNTVLYPLVSKTQVDDLMDDLQATGGLVLEKLEGLAITAEGTVLVVNDNDGVDDSNGETQLFRLKGLL